MAKRFVGMAHWGVWVSEEHMQAEMLPYIMKGLLSQITELWCFIIAVWSVRFFDESIAFCIRRQQLLSAVTCTSGGMLGLIQKKTQKNSCLSCGVITLVVLTLRKSGSDVTCEACILLLVMFWNIRIKTYSSVSKEIFKDGAILVMA